MGASAFLLLLLGAGPQEAPPVRMELPPGYQPWQARGTSQHNWAAALADGSAQVVVDHFRLEAPGARGDLVAEDRRRNLWGANLEFQGLPYRIQAWEGRWAGEEAYGSLILFTRGEERRAVVERLLLLDDHLVVAAWEGPRTDLESGREALESFVLPGAWRPEPAPERDPDRGLGDGARWVPPPGRMELRFDLGRAAEGLLEITVVLVPEGDGPEELRFHLPEHPAVLAAGDEPGPAVQTVRRGEDGRFRVQYRIRLEEDNTALQELGLHFRDGALAVLDPRWLAWPEPPAAEPEGAVQVPPAWSLEVLAPPVFTAVGPGPAVEDSLDPEETVRRFRFREVERGRGWPFLLVGRFQEQSVAGRRLWLRTGAHSQAVEAPVRLLGALQEALESWLPAAAEDWALTTFPHAGDLPLPGLLLLDEELGWLSHAPDEAWRDVDRAAGLARRLAALPFGLRLRGLGTAAGFLEASLSEYSAARMLEAAGHAGSASRLRAWWQQREEAAGALPRPLSLLPRADVLGAQRLLSRGGLVWQALEQRAGREHLDAVLESFLERGGFWTTEELRSALEARTGADWEGFFQDFIYGRRLPGP